MVFQICGSNIIVKDMRFYVLSTNNVYLNCINFDRINEILLTVGTLMFFYFLESS